MTYLYGFTKYVGSDKISKISGNLKSGDLFLLGDEYFLSLGDEIPFFEQYVYEIREAESNFQLIEKNLISTKTVDFINYMVYERYCPYYNVMKYFLPTEIDKLLTRKISKKSKNIKIQNQTCIILPQNTTQDLSFCEDGQTLIVFPDLWTLINMTDENFRQKEGIDTLLSTNTQNQKDKSRRNIKNGNTKVIYSTHSEIFQDYKNLKKIIIVYPHKRYYSNQQDPRYKTLSVVKKLSEIYKCELIIVEN